MKSQQRWYWALDYFNNTVSLLYGLYSCQIRSWSLRFRQFGVCQVNTSQSSTRLHGCLPNRRAKFGTEIFARFWDIVIFVLGYFWFTAEIRRTFKQSARTWQTSDRQTDRPRYAETCSYRRNRLQCRKWFRLIMSQNVRCLTSSYGQSLSSASASQLSIEVLEQCGQRGKP